MRINSLLDAKKFAILTGLSYQTVLNYVDAGILPYKIIKRHCYFDKETLALGLILSVKGDISDNILDMYFFGCGVAKKDDFKCFSHDGTIDFEELCKKINSVYDDNFKVLDVGYSQEVINMCKPLITKAKEEDLAAFDRRWTNRFPDGGDKNIYKIKRNHIIENYSISGNKAGKKIESILDNFVYDGLRKKVLHESIKDIRSGVITSFDYDTTLDTFNVADFVEQVLLAVKTKRYTEINVCIYGDVPKYVSDICKMLSDSGVLTELVHR